MSQTENREYWIDAIRSFACICVITTHAPIPNSTNGLIFGSIFNYFSTAGASILFFMISGALILYKEKPIAPFLKQRFSRIFLPMVIWSSLSLLIDYLSGNILFSDLIAKITMIPFVPQIGTYWFIYTIFGIYLISQPLACWLNSCNKKDIRFLLLIWGITLFIPYLSILTPQFSNMTAYSGGWLYYFYGYLGYAVLGYYLRKYINISFNIRYFIIFLIICCIPLILYNIQQIPHLVIQDRMSANITLLAICYFLIIKHIKFPKKIANILYIFAQHSFGIYLVHILIMRKLYGQY